MIIRALICFIAKRIYPEDYSTLKNKLLDVYKNIKKYNDNNNFIIFKQLLISGEDHRFRYHCGFDVIAIIRAIKNKIIKDKTEGASTIEQQVVRVLINDFKKTFKRKIKEIFLSTTLQELVPRKDIPNVYLFIAYYGVNLIGFEQVYSKLNSHKNGFVDIELAAEIVARIKYPELVNNTKRKNQIVLRKQYLLYLYKKHKNRKFIKVYD
jgi:membrane carboxypeptidase/penicillin-binding protein